MLKGFAFTMIVGIITGTYSSVFIAAAIVVLWQGDASPAAPVAAGRVGRADGDAKRKARQARAGRRKLPVNWFAAALLGIVQGLTEFLPVSSTAHLLLGARFLGFDDPGGVFTVMIQLGSILAVVWLYRAKILRVLYGPALGSRGAAVRADDRGRVPAGAGRRRCCSRDS